MPLVSITNFDGLNTQNNPLGMGDGNIIQSLNLVSDPFGAKSKRPGYVTFLGTPDNASVNRLFSWYRLDGTTFNLYRNSGSVLYSSLQGTGAWTVTGNGTFDASGTAIVGQTVLNDVMIVGDGKGSTRHSTDGTSFSNTSLAPVSPFFEVYQDRVYASGTSSVLFYSAIDDATNWAFSGTSDSSSINIPGEGRNSFLFKNYDRLMIVKNAHQQLFRWDGANLTDLATNSGPTSPYSYASQEGVAFWLNRLGVYSYAGSSPILVTNPTQKIIYNKSGSAIAGTVFDNADGGIYLYDYFVSIGTTTDDYTGVTTNNSILKYDMRLNETMLWQFADFPQSYHSYKDINGNLQMIFGNGSGQVFQLSGTAQTDNGTPIQSILELMIYARTTQEKNWYWMRAAMNPGCEAQVEVAVCNNLSQRARKYVSVGQAIDGVLECRIPTGQGNGQPGARGRYLFVKFSDNSTTNPFQIFGLEVEYDVNQRRASG